MFLYFACTLERYLFLSFCGCPFLYTSSKRSSLVLSIWHPQLIFWVLKNLAMRGLTFCRCVARLWLQNIDCAFSFRWWYWLFGSTVSFWCWSLVAVSWTLSQFEIFTCMWVLFDGWIWFLSVLARLMPASLAFLFISVSKIFKNILWAIRKTLSLKGFSNQSKGPPGSMDEPGIEKIV